MEIQLLSVLANAKFPLHARDIRQLLARCGTSIPEHTIIGKLRDLMKEGKVEFVGGKWRSAGGCFVPAINLDGTKESRYIQSPSTSPIGFASERFHYGADSPTPHPQAAESRAEKGPAIFEGPWGPFRALLDYYRDCIRNEGGSEAIARLDELNSKYLFVSRPGMWLPRAGFPWSLSIPLGSYLGALIPQLASVGQDTLLVLGYPLQVVHFQREGEPDSYLLKPIFHFALEHKLQNGALSMYVDDPRIQVNLEWLNHSFRDSERQRSFLSACGFVGGDGDNETVGFHVGPQAEHLTATLAAFMPNDIREPLVPNLIPREPLKAPVKTGVYNRAVIMLARRPQYTRSLLRELSRIREASDEELDGTALRYLFSSSTFPDQNDPNKEPKITTADVTALNSEQRKAVASLLNSQITVITGPPGTGKSQVVSAAVANAHLFGKSVLFASRNHKAIDAVYDRCRDHTNRPLLTRCNSRDDPTLRFTFTQAIAMLLSGEANTAAGEEAAQILRNLELLLEERIEKLQHSDRIRECRERLGLLEEESSILSLRMPGTVTSRLSEKLNDFPTKRLEGITFFADSLDSQKKLSLFLSALALTPSWIALRRGLEPFVGLPTPRGYMCTPARLSAFLKEKKLLQDATAFCLCRSQILPLEEAVKGLPDLGTLTSAVADLTTRIIALALLALERLVSARVGLPPGEDREALANVRSAMQYIDSGSAPATLQNSMRGVLRSQLVRLLEHIPCWAVTSLSVGSRIPLLPGLFDLAVIDEASQSDIPSAIPVLFRAKRAGVVGDPRQLTHVTNLSLAKDSMLRRRAGLDRLTDQRFSYIETSLYSLFADTNGISPIFLSETYRSVQEITSYSNDLFYGGRLNVATDASKFPQLRNMSPGIHWTEVEGEVRSGGVGGAHCRREVEAIEALVREILLGNGFRGTLGIVTPFREQANRLKDAIFGGAIPWEVLQSANVAVDTSHGFQGGERDVILFSLCAGPDMPAGSLHFLRETGNLFNVAVSRARAVLHVVGNRNWASYCGIRHVERLARPVHFTEPGPEPGSWAPHESPWEKYLFEALKAAGLSPIPQHPGGLPQTGPRPYP